MFALALGAVLAGCGGSDNPSLEDVAKQYAKSYCVKVEQCMGAEAFDATYPGGQPECAAGSLKIRGTNEQSICTQEEWDKCSADLEKTTCVVGDAGDLSRPKIPKSCLDC